MPHKRSPEAKAKRTEAATLHTALRHTRKRELDVGAREERVGRRERNAPELNDKLLALHLETRGLLQQATNLAGHHLTDEHGEKAWSVFEAQSAGDLPCPLPPPTSLPCPIIPCATVPPVADSSALPSVRCLLQAPKIKAGIGEINYRELMTHAIQSEKAVLALRRAVPALRVLEARTAAIGRTAQALEEKLLEFDDEPSVHAAARARYHTPVPAAVRAAVLHGPAPMAPVPWAAGYKIRRVQR